MIILYLFLLLCIFVCLVCKSRRYLHMLQQNLYNENNRYLKWVMKNGKLFLDLDLSAILLCLVGLMVVYDVEKFAIVLSLILGGVYIFMSYVWRNRLADDQNKKPLVVTARIKRLIVTVSILYLIPVVFLLWKNTDAQFVWAMFTILSVMVVLNPIIVFLSNGYPVKSCQIFDDLYLSIAGFCHHLFQCFSLIISDLKAEPSSLFQIFTCLRHNLPVKISVSYTHLTLPTT